MSSSVAVMNNAKKSNEQVKSTIPGVAKLSLAISSKLRIIPEAYVLKWKIFVVQKLVLHQNGVELCQQSIGDIRISPAMS